MNLQELLRRLQAGESRNAISRNMRLSPNTVSEYRQWAEAQGLLAGSLPELATLEQLRSQTFRPQRPKRHPNQSSIEAHRTEISALLAQGYKPRAIWLILQQRHPAAFTASEAAVWRLIQHIQGHQLPATTMRLESKPGEAAQVDFGFLGHLLDAETGLRRKAWVFVMVLAWSRHMYAEIVPDQKLLTWLLCHQRALAFFGGVPARLTIDNLKAAIIRAYMQDADPEVQQSYRECAQHYDFLIDPCLPRKPQHKGKVERGGVGYIQQNFWPRLAGATVDGTLPTFPEANRQLRHWLMTVAGLRVHGTTREVPLTRFEQVEKAALQPLPPAPYDPAIWKQCKLHRDSYVNFEQAYYSAPSRLVGQTLWLRAGLQEVRLFSENHALLATHARATHPGQRLTQPDHFPAEKARALTLTRETCQAQALAVGPATAQAVTELLAERPLDHFRSVVRLLTLADTHGAQRLEAACALGLAFGDANYVTLKRILRAGLENTPLDPTPLPVIEELRFARRPEELAHILLAGQSWT